MTVLAHVSDLHFGTEDPAVAAGLLADLTGADAPAVLAVSGDLTQRARPDEFTAARAFLDRVRCPVVVVPGNHDVPLYDVVSRLFHPFARYERYLKVPVETSYFDDVLAVVGINTAHGLTVKSGTISKAKAEAAAAAFTAHPARWQIVVTHHPFAMPAGVDDAVVDGAEAALEIFGAAGVDAILTGHLHVTYTADVAGFRHEDQAMLSVNAGTCISTRRRGEANGYNRLTFTGDELAIVHRLWNGTAFEDGPSKVYRRRGTDEDKQLTKVEQTL